MAQPAVQPHAANDRRPADLMAKAEAIAAKIADLRQSSAEQFNARQGEWERLVARERAEAADLTDNLRTVGQQALVREALTRSELTVALGEALIGRALAQGRARDEALRAYVGRIPVSRRRHNRLSRSLDRLLCRLRSLGQALLIARSGVWRGTGRTLFDLRHMAAYARRAADPTVAPPALVDQAWYLAAYPDVATCGLAPLVHYLVAGAGEGRSPHPLFDAGFYRRHNAAGLAATGVSPLEHFVREGAAQGRDPHPLFDVAHYLSQRPDLAPGEDVLSHYLRTGAHSGLSPHPLFDPAWYRGQGARIAGDVPPLVHYVTVGWRQGLTPHPLVDPAWYLEQNPDVAAAGYEPLSHFLTAGAAEGRSPGPWFDLPHYVAARGAGLPSDVNPLVDYLRFGAWVVAEARPGFPTAAYLAGAPELVREGVTPLEHWARRSAR